MSKRYWDFRQARIRSDRASVAPGGILCVEA